MIFANRSEKNSVPGGVVRSCRWPSWSYRQDGPECNRGLELLSRRT